MTRICVYENCMGGDGPVVYACDDEDVRGFAKQASEGKRCDDIVFDGFSMVRGEFEIDLKSKRILGEDGQLLAEFDEAFSIEEL